MIDWKWLVLAVVVGVCAGYALAALLVVSAEAEKRASGIRHREHREHEVENKKRPFSASSASSASSVARPSDQAAGLRKRMAEHKQNEQLAQSIADGHLIGIITGMDAE